MLDLHRLSKARGEDAIHKKYCSVNVQLSRVRSKEDLKLLQPLSLDDLDIRPHRQLCNEDLRLQQLADRTMQLEIESNLDGSEA